VKTWALFFLYHLVVRVPSPKTIAQRVHPGLPLRLAFWDAAAGSACTRLFAFCSRLEQAELRAVHARSVSLVYMALALLTPERVQHDVRPAGLLQLGELLPE